MAPWRWWDGRAWTPVIYGPYGESWPTSTKPPTEPKGPGIRGGGTAAVGAGVGFALTLVVAIAFGLVHHLDANNPWYILASQLALWVGFVGAVLVASRRNGSSSLARDYGLSLPRRDDLWLGPLGGLIGRLVPTLLLVVILLAGGNLGRPNSAAPKVLGSTPAGTTGWVIVVSLTVVGAPIVEELFFRGLLQGAFTRRVGAVPAIFVTALMFSFAHILNEGLLAPLELFPAAVILGYLKHKTGRLAAGMLAHATFNATLYLLFLVPAFR